MQSKEASLLRAQRKAPQTRYSAQDLLSQESMTIAKTLEWANQSPAGPRTESQHLHLPFPQP